jgi:hypothetical protein
MARKCKAIGATKKLIEVVFDFSAVCRIAYIEKSCEDRTR